MTSLYESAQPNTAGYRDVTPSQVVERSHDVCVVDVREPDEYVGELGHIGGARLVPLATALAEAPGWSKEVELVLVCRSGARSGRAAAALSAMGFSRVMNMTGGMLAWSAARLPVERGPS